jgi:hypothetical protein
VVAIISILAALATAGLLRSRMTANEVGAIASLRVVATAQKVYATSCGGGAYATTFIVLGTPPGGGQSFISADLGSSLTADQERIHVRADARRRVRRWPARLQRPGDQLCILCSGLSALRHDRRTRVRGETRTARSGKLMGGTPPAEPFGAPATPIR